MTDGQAILRGVLDNPADDAARLVYADWLEEHGENDRAEFIRSQVHLAGMQPWDEGYVALDIRCQQLERAHPEWLAGADKFVFTGRRFCGQPERSFERGFLTRVKMSPPQFAKSAVLFDENPIRSLQFEMEKRSGTAWLTRQALTQLTGVEFALMRTPRRSREIRACLQRLRPLDHFGLLGCLLEPADGEAIFAEPVVAAARSLWIGGTRLSEGAESSFATAAWPNLRRLVRVWVSDVDWLRSPWVAQLHQLTISDTEPNLDPARRRLLTEVLPGTNIQTLELGWWELDVPGGRALGRAVAASRVQSLAIGQTNTSAKVARALLTPDTLAGLRVLYLSWAELDADTVGRLAGSGLRTCALGHLTCDALAALGKASGLGELADLRLGLAWKTPDDPLADVLRDVLDSGTLPQLTRLMVYDITPGFGEKARHGDELAQAIADSPAASSLRELHLGEAVTMAGAKALANSPHLSGLQLLNVRVWPKDPDAERLLRERFGAGAYLDIVSQEF